MKAIETKYRGVTFRSKTEAKWAYFMDLIGCSYEYEPEGYDLGDGVFYSPDFYLPSMDTFLEIKPAGGGGSSPTRRFADVMQKRIVTMFGEPCDWMNEYRRSIDLRNERIMSLAEWPVIDGWYFGGRAENHFFCVCFGCETVGIQCLGQWPRIRCNCPEADHRNPYETHPKISSAISSIKDAFRWTKS